MGVHLRIQKDRGRRYTERSEGQGDTSLYHTPQKWYKQPSRHKCCHFWNDLGIRIRQQQYYLGDGSMLIINWILYKATSQWSICNHLEKLRGLIFQTQDFKCTHIFRYTYLQGGKLGFCCIVQTQSQNHLYGYLFQQGRTT